MSQIVMLLLLFAAGCSMLKSQPAIVAVVNAASFQSGVPVGGALATAFVSGLTALKPGTYVAPPALPLPLTLGGLRVLLNKEDAPLLAVIASSDPSTPVQVNFQVPLSASASLSGPFLPPGVSAYPGYLSITDGVNHAVITSLPIVTGVSGGGFFRLQTSMRPPFMRLIPAP